MLTNERCDWVGLCMNLKSLCEACEYTDSCEIKEETCDEQTGKI